MLSLHPIWSLNLQPPNQELPCSPDSASQVPLPTAPAFPTPPARLSLLLNFQKDIRSIRKTFLDRGQNFKHNGYNYFPID